MIHPISQRYSTYQMFKSSRIAQFGHQVSEENKLSTGGKPWKWGIFGSAVLLMMSMGVGLYQIGVQSIHGSHDSWISPQPKKSGVPEWVQDMGSEVVRIWEHGDPIEQAFLGFVGLIVGGTGAAGAYILGSYVQDKMELKAFLKRFSQAKQTGSHAVTSTAQEGLESENSYIRGFVISQIHQLPVNDSKKMKWYVEVLRDPDDDVYQLAQKTVREFVKLMKIQKKESNAVVLLEKLENLSPGFYKTTSTTYVYQKIGNVTVLRPQTTTTWHRHQYSVAYQRVENELQKLLK